MLCPTRFVVDSMESINKGGGVAKVCSFQTGLRFGTLLRDMYAHIRTYYVRPNIFSETKKHPPEVRSPDGHTCRTCLQNSDPSLIKRRGYVEFSAEHMHLLGSCL